MSINYQREGDIVTLTMDRAGHSANVIDEAFGLALHQALERLEGEQNLAGVILTSSKDTFLAGGDLQWLYGVQQPAVIFDSAEKLKQLLRRLEQLGVPVVAAINGAAMGGGLELALACHRRVAINNRRLKIGFPEVSLGLIPGGGGATRLTRLLGIQKALPLILEGKILDPAQALESGLIDDLAADAGEMLAKARAWLRDNPDAQQPWDRRGYRLPGGDPRDPALTPVLAIAPAMLRKKSYGNYPAAEAAMSAVVEGAMVDFETASRIESRYMAEVACGQVAKNMINAFWFQLNTINAGGSRPAGIAPRRFEKVGILGAGMMGHGIAYVSASAGMEVVLKDVSQEKAQSGFEQVRRLLEKQVKRGKLDADGAAQILQRITPTADAAQLAGCDLVIEAVFEDRELKARVTAEAESQILPSAVFASNTSTLPISGLAQRSARPQNFIGLHFFSPVHLMRLVEIIVGDQTSDETLARAFDYVLSIKRTPIVVNDRRGFYTSRVFSTYLKEGMALLAEGQPPRAIESAGLKAGMPVGPLALADEVSLELIAHIQRQTIADLAAEGRTLPAHPADAVVELLVGQLGRKGRASGAGFYDYPIEGRKQLWPGLTEHFASNGQGVLAQPEMIDRLLYVQALESARCYAEGVLRSAADANIGSIFGWGFAPFHGGTLQFINACGLPVFIERASELAGRYGERFQPPELLLKMAANGEKFAEGGA